MDSTNTNATTANILIVDHDSLTRLMLQQELEQHGYRVTVVESGQEALLYVNENEVDLILLSAYMPKMDGYEVCTHLREKPQYSTIPILMLSSLNDDAISRCFTAGATNFVTKPLNLSLVSQQVKYALRAQTKNIHLSQSQILLSHAQSIVGLGHWNLDLDNKIVQCSSETVSILGLPMGCDRLALDDFMMLRHPDDRELLQHHISKVINKHDSCNTEYRIIKPDGKMREIQERIDFLETDTENGLQVLGTLRDITEDKRKDALIQHQAMYDCLTELPNRSLFRDRLLQAIDSAKRNKQHLGLLFLDLDRFKLINDTMGHGVGDHLLKTIADRLTACVRKGDTVARWGGDEFTIILKNIKDDKDAASIIKNMMHEISKPCHLDGKEIITLSSAGIAIYPKDSEDPDALIKHADTAMYRAKEKGGMQYRYFTNTMNAYANERLSLENALRKALERNELSVYYQPQLDMRSGELMGMEALLRWHHPELGIIPPDKFIPIAEETGLIVPIGEWTLRTACQQCADWHLQGHKNLIVGVNLSVRQFHYNNLAQQIKQALDDSGLLPEHLNLEITESLAMQETKHSIDVLHEIKSMGISISIDDFGTGHSSLVYLHKLPVDIVKIDRAFISSIPASHQDGEIVKAIIAMTHALDLKVLAEGIETQEQYNFLHFLQCDQMQGYLLSRPLNTEDFGHFLSKASNKDGCTTSSTKQYHRLKVDPRINTRKHLRIVN